MNRVFAGRTLVWKQDTSRRLIRKNIRQINSFRDEVKETFECDGSDEDHGVVQRMLMSLVGEVDWDGAGDVLQELLGEAVTDLLGSMVPFVSQIRNGAAAINHWRRAAKAGWRAHKHRRRTDQIHVESARAACQALTRLVQRESNEQLLIGSTRMVQCAAATGAMFVDGGTLSTSATGLIGAGARLAHRIYLLARNVQERNRANAILGRTGMIDHEIFANCPLLGAFALQQMETSTILGISTGMVRGGYLAREGTTAEVVRLVREVISPLKADAARFVSDSYFTLDR
jgi:hypothetical protein